MAGLDDATKAEIADAVRIVAADKHWTMVRDVHERTTPKETPEDPPKEGDPTPPPTKPEDEKEKEEPKRSAWWGDRLHG